MKRIGIIGGMSPESTLHYYERINRQVNELAQDNDLGEHTSADIVLRSVNFEEYCQLMDADNWAEIAKKLYVEATTLICKNDCDYVAVATNTMHKVANDICPSDQLVHIGDCIAEECIASGFKRVAIIGTKTTMTESFMKDRMRQHGLEVGDPFTDEEIDEIDRVIFEELCHGEADTESSENVMSMLYQADTRDMEKGGKGFDAFILGCTELEMLVDALGDYIIANPSKFKHRFKLVNSTQSHINKLVDLCLS